MKLLSSILALSRGPRATFCAPHLLLLFVCLGTANVTSGGVPQELNRVLVANETGVRIEGMWYRPGNPQEPAVEWGPNVLSTTAISHGKSRGFYVHFPDTCEMFDFLFQDEHGSQYQLQHFEVCSDSVSVVVVDGSLRGARGQEAGPAVRLELHNDTSEALAYVFYSPEEFDMWGFDLLGDTALLNPGESFFVLLASGDARHYDFLALGETGSLYLGRIDQSIDGFAEIYASLYEQ